MYLASKGIGTWEGLFHCTIEWALTGHLTGRDRVLPAYFPGPCSGLGRAQAGRIAHHSFSEGTLIVKNGANQILLLYLRKLAFNNLWRVFSPPLKKSDPVLFLKIQWVGAYIHFDGYDQ